MPSPYYLLFYRVSGSLHRPLDAYVLDHDPGLGPYHGLGLDLGLVTYLSSHLVESICHDFFLDFSSDAPWLHLDLVIVGDLWISPVYLSDRRLPPSYPLSDLDDGGLYETSECNYQRLRVHTKRGKERTSGLLVLLP